MQYTICLNKNLENTGSNCRTESKHSSFLNDLFCNKDTGIKNIEYVSENKLKFSKIHPSSANEFISVMTTAFCQHKSISFKPDVFKILITHGVATHINLDPEKYRNIFVSHEDKQKITIRRDDFVLGKKNPWHEVIDCFSDQINKYIGNDIHQLIKNDFTTTGLNERIASEIVLMDCVKAFFEYTVLTRCGFPYIILNGTPDDWNKLLNDFEGLKILNKTHNMGLDNWFDKLTPIMKEICNTVPQQTSNESFWNSMYNYESGSGSQYISGWLTNFYPYITDSKTLYSNPMLNNALQIKPNSIPCGLSKVPFVWDYYGKDYPMILCSGIIGASVYEHESTEVFQPEFGWAIGHVMKS